MLLQWLLVFHVVGFSFWVVGLMLLTRILAFHADEQPAVQARLGGLERRINYGFALSGAIIAIVTGTWMLALYDWGPLLSGSAWGPTFHIKLTFVVVLIGVHAVIHGKLNRLAAGQPARSGPFKALHGIVGTLFLAIVVSIFIVRANAQAKAQAKTAEAADAAAAPR